MTSLLHSFWLRLLALLTRLALLLAWGAFAVSASAQTTVTFFHNDILGSPAIAPDANGTVVWKENYLPYGHRLQAPPTGCGLRAGSSIPIPVYSAYERAVTSPKRGFTGSNHKIILQKAKAIDLGRASQSLLSGSSTELQQPVERITRERPPLRRRRRTQSTLAQTVH